MALAPETIQLIELLGWAFGLALGIIVFAVALAEIGASFIRTNMP